MAKVSDPDISGSALSGQLRLVKRVSYSMGGFVEKLHLSRRYPIMLKENEWSFDVVRTIEYVFVPWYVKGLPE